MGFVEVLIFVIFRARFVINYYFVGYSMVVGFFYGLEEFRYFRFCSFVFLVFRFVFRGVIFCGLRGRVGGVGFCGVEIRVCVKFSVVRNSCRFGVWFRRLCCFERVV